MRKSILILAFIVIQFALHAQNLTQDQINSLQEKVIALVLEKYVDEGIALQIAYSIRQIEYAPGSIDSFRKKLGNDIRKFSNDKHFQVFYSAEEDFSKTISNNSTKNNFGFRKVEILNGNIGYLRLSSFEDPELAGETARSALNFLSNSDAIIIDLRDNNGGRKSMVQLILSYFFEENSKHLYSIYGRQEEYHGYTEVDLREKKMSDTPLYILINEESFSAAEMMAFILQKQNRATLVGSATAGGGHTIGNFVLGSGFSINIPVGKVVDPTTKTGWEKVGVRPEIEVTNDLYIETAHLLSLKNKIEKKDYASEIVDLQWNIDILKSKVQPIKIDQTKLKSYVGNYGRRIISYRDGILYYQGRAGIDKAKLIPIDEFTFRFDEVDFFRIKFILDEKGKVTSLKGLYDDGFEDETSRGKSQQ